MDKRATGLTFSWGDPSALVAQSIELRKRSAEIRQQSEQLRTEAASARMPRCVVPGCNCRDSLMEIVID